MKRTGLLVLRFTGRSWFGGSQHSRSGHPDVYRSQAGPLANDKHRNSWRVRRKSECATDNRL